MKKILIVIISLVITASGNMFGQKDQFSELADATVKKFSGVVTAQNFKYFGLSSADALKNVMAGEAIIHYAVGLTKLQDYREDMDPKEIVEEMGYVTVPLYNKENKRLEAFVLLNKNEGEYQSTGIGEAPYSKNFLTMKKRAKKGNEANLIRVPALNIAYMGIMVSDTLNLIQLLDKEQDMEPRPASEVFVELSGQITKGYGDVPH